MAETDRLILTVDLGTTSCKVGLTTPNGDVVAFTQESDAAPVHFLPGGGAEQDPADWWAVITRTVRRLFQETGIPVERVAGISCCAPWSGTVPVDRDGTPLGNAIIWMDTRGAPYVHEITGGLIRVEGYGLLKALTWIRLTGGIPTHAGKDPIAHILFLKHERPDIYRATYKFLEPKDYLNLKLTGHFAADYASIILHWVTDNRDIHHVRYDERLLRMAGIERDKLPDLYPTTHVLGPLLPGPAEDLGLPAGIPVVIATPDYHAAIVGSGAVRDFEPHIYIGTSSWLTCHVPYKKTDLTHNMASLPSALPGRYFVANEQESAGSTLTFLRDRIFFPRDDLLPDPPPADVFARLNRVAAQSPPGANGVIFTPWLYGERTPVEDATLRGGFFNVSLNSTRADLVRAVFEGVALNTRWLLPHVENFARRRFEAINIIGGGAVSDLWCQIFADVLDRPIRRVKDPAAAGLRGLGVLAGLSLGLTTLEAYAQQVPIERTFEPRPETRALYDEVFTAFLEIYKRLKPLYHRLNARRGTGGE